MAKKAYAKGAGKMKKGNSKLAIMLILTLLIVFLSPVQSQGNQMANTTEDYQVIPDEAIRLRILANSDKKNDQVLKREVRDAVNAEITKWVDDLTSIQSATNLIQERLPEIEKIVANVLQEKNIDQTSEVEYGDNIQFPTKLYGPYIYPAGKYKAILITLGDGKGANWWCVLFPPLCFLDFSNGTTVAQNDLDINELDEEQLQMLQEQKQPVEVKFFLKELINRS